MKTYKVVVRCVGGDTITSYVNAWTMTEAQQFAELGIKRAFLRLTIFRVK